MPIKIGGMSIGATDPKTLEQIRMGKDPYSEPTTPAVTPEALPEHPKVASLSVQHRIKYDAFGGHPTNPSESDLDYIDLLQGKR